MASSRAVTSDQNGLTSSTVVIVLLLASFRAAVKIVVVGAISLASSTIDISSRVTCASYLIAFSSDFEVEVSLTNVLKAFIFCKVLVKVLFTDDLTRVTLS